MAMTKSEIELALGAAKFFAVIAAPFALGMLFALAREGRRSKHGVCAPGVVVGHEGGSGSANHVPIVRFAVAGRAYEIKGRNRHRKSSRPLGMQLQVIFAPWDPEGGRLDVFSERYSVTLILAVLAGLFGLPALALGLLVQVNL